MSQSHRAAMALRVLSQAGVREVDAPRPPPRHIYSSRIKRIRALCHARGIAICELPTGAFRLLARGVDLMTVDLAFISEEDLKPVTPQDTVAIVRAHRSVTADEQRRAGAAARWAR